MTLPVEVVKARGKPTAEYSPSAIILYGIGLTSLDAWIGKAFQSGAQPTRITIQPQPSAPNVGGRRAAAGKLYQSALIHAFAYQGHCYHLPEPVIIIVDGPGELAKGHDFDNTGYMMWFVEKLDRTLQLEPTSDTFEEIILKPALAGTKQPISYASRAQLSHRGGKLSE
jgi:hypothetical protein